MTYRSLHLWNLGQGICLSVNGSGFMGPLFQGLAATPC